MVMPATSLATIMSTGTAVADCGARLHCRGSNSTGAPDGLGHCTSSAAERENGVVLLRRAVRVQGSNSGEE